MDHEDTHFKVISQFDRIPTEPEKRRLMSAYRTNVDLIKILHDEVLLHVVRFQQLASNNNRTPKSRNTEKSNYCE